MDFIVIALFLGLLGMMVINMLWIEDRKVVLGLVLLIAAIGINFVFELNVGAIFVMMLIIDAIYFRITVSK